MIRELIRSRELTMVDVRSEGEGLPEEVGILVQETASAGDRLAVNALVSRPAIDAERGEACDATRR